MGRLSKDSQVGLYCPPWIAECIEIENKQITNKPINPGFFFRIFLMAYSTKKSVKTQETIGKNKGTRQFRALAGLRLYFL